MRKFLLAATLLFTSSIASFAASFGTLAGTYAGTTEKGADIIIVIPGSGTPIYSIRKTLVSVTSAAVSGKTITLNVGPNGKGRIVLSSNGKNMSYSYTDDEGSTTALLVKSK